MSKQCSKPYEIDGSKYSFDFVDGKLAGIRKADIGSNFGSSLENEYMNPNLSSFADIAATDEAVYAFNVAKYGSNKNAYVDTVEQKTSAELQAYHAAQNKKITNQEPITNDISKPPSLAFTEPRSDTYNAYQRGKQVDSDILAYPFDIDTNQDHLKISKYKYKRQLIETLPNSGKDKPTTMFNLSGPGDDVRGQKLIGSVILPMPKVTDVNGADYGENKLSLTGLAILGGVNKVADLITQQGVGEEGQKALRRVQEAGAEIGLSGEDVKAFGGASAANAAGQLAGAVTGTNLDANTILARRGGNVINPNAEMLFTGPVIRDFTFDFLMIARSQSEGDEIRKIIHFLKKGMAPKYRNKIFLSNPDVFVLEYRNGDGILKTVNRFATAMALTTMGVDYAPNGYWSAYRDSQPVALKLNLNFTEMRPVYEQDQSRDELIGTVGY